MKNLLPKFAALGLLWTLSVSSALRAADIPPPPPPVFGPNTVLSNSAVATATAGAAAAAAAAAATGSAQTGNASTVVVVAPTVLPPITVAPTVTAPAANDQPAASGETTIQLDIGSGIRAVPAARVSVPNNEKLRLVAPFSAAASGATSAAGAATGSATGTSIASTSTFVWMKDGRAFATTTSNSVTIDRVQSSDSGTYTCLSSTPTSQPVPSQALILAVGPISRVQNVSVRGILNAGPGQNFVTGFVVATGSQPKKMIVRAVGPGLTQFGVPNTLARPVLRIFDGSGAPYTNGYVYNLMVGGLTPETDLADSLARVGAFPTPAGSADAVLLLPFTSGAYTAQVTSADGRGGDVLVEIYEVP